MSILIKLRRDTYQNWYNVNPTLASGEPSYDTTNNKIKVGDGTTAWRSLNYLSDIVQISKILASGTPNSTNFLRGDGVWAVPSGSGGSGGSGATGPKGDKGDRGDTGSAGPTGATGGVGPTGPRGQAGSGGAGGGLAGRETASVTSSSTADGSAGNYSITGFIGYGLYAIQTSVAAWVTIYSSVAARSADSTRDQNTDPLPGSGVIAEVITTGAQTIKLTPAAIGFSDETVPTNAIPIKIVNLSGDTTTITVTLTLLCLEV